MSFEVKKEVASALRDRASSHGRRRAIGAFLATGGSVFSRVRSKRCIPIDFSSARPAFLLSSGFFERRLSSFGKTPQFRSAAAISVFQAEKARNIE